MRNSSINNLINIIICLVFLFFPFWEVLTAQVKFFFSIPFLFSGLLKYFLLIFLMFLLLFYRVLNEKFFVQKDSCLLLFFVVYIVLHLVGSDHLFLKLDGLKYEFLPVFIISLLLSQRELHLIDLDFLIKIILFQGFVVMFVAISEYFNPDILVIFYRKPLSLIPHVQWFSSSRLISVIGNPINLGSFTIIWIISYLYTIHVSSKKTFIFLFPIFLFMSSFVILMTLSRASLIVYIFIVILCLIFSLKDIKSFVFLFFVLLFCAVLVEFFFDQLNVDILKKRFGGLIAFAEYSENVRVYNWMNSIKSMDTIELLWGKGIGASTPTLKYAELYRGIIVENGFVSLIISYGIVGLFLYLTIWIRFFILTVLILKRKNPKGLFLFLFFIAYSLFNLSNDYYRNYPFVLYYWFFYFFAEKESRKYRLKKRKEYTSVVLF